ncbi:MAG: chitobiase/beta-hexosaminidase C-terminal domain-containing protein [Candidatus Hydrogenedentes bacterium]|nr:chitobiase/beta-hexosaminidase C-terminal domain-containing protein [Candidatus Hydrogenedentota bacterium]
MLKTNDLRTKSDRLRTYNDSGSWPNQADGQGWSLVILNPQGDASDPSNWALSEFIGGSPGGSEINPNTPVADTEFSVDRGFYDVAFTLELSTETFGAAIRYTLDGSTPTCSTGTLYTGPILISGTAIVRAIACKSGWLSTNVDTQTYLFVNDIITQSHPGGGDGSYDNPFDTLWGGLVAAPASGTVKIKGNTGDSVSDETMTINQAVTIDAAGGAVRIGVLGGRSSGNGWPSGFVSRD